MKTRKVRRGGARGFSVLEVLVVLVVIGVLAGLGIPAVVKSLGRLQLESGSRVCVSTLRRARNEAIRRGVPVVVGFDETRGALSVFADVDNDVGEPESDLMYNPCEGCVPARPARATDYELPSSVLPGRVWFWGAEDASPGGAGMVEGFTPAPDDPAANPLIVFDPDGSVRDAGALRIGSGAWPRDGAGWADRERNFLEVRVVVASTGRIEVRKWLPGAPATASYQPLLHGDDGPNWIWF